MPSPPPPVSAPPSEKATLAPAACCALGPGRRRDPDPALAPESRLWPAGGPRVTGRESLLLSALLRNRSCLEDILRMATFTVAACHSHTFCWLESQRSGACQWAPSRSVSDVQSVFRGFALSRSPPAGLTSPVLGTAPGGTLFPGVPSLRWRAGPPSQGGDGSPLRRSRWSPGPCRPGRQGAPSSCRRPSVRLPESALAREGAQR